MLILQSTALLFTTLDFYSLPITQAQWQPRSAPSRQASHWPLVCFLSKVGPFSQATWSCFPAQLHSAALLSQRALFCPALCLSSCFRGIYLPLFKNILEVYSFRSRSKKTPQERGWSSLFLIWSHSPNFMVCLLRVTDSRNTQFLIEVWFEPFFSPK